MACPFFSPTVRVENIALPHRARLPLGAAWRGTCCAPGAEGVQLTDVDLECCNLGYATACPRLPKQRPADAVRFSIAKRSPERVLVEFVLESGHLPVAHGQLEYDRSSNQWASRHSDAGVQRLAECFLQARGEFENSELPSA